MTLLDILAGYNILRVLLLTMQIINGFELDDRVANYGDGVFTTMRVKQGSVAMLSRHVKRLLNDATQLGLTLESSDIVKVVRQALAEQQNGVLKLLISAGQGGRGYLRKTDASLLCAYSWHPMPAVYSQWQKDGINLGFSSIKLASQPLLAGLKHANRLEQVLVKQELAQTTYHDVLVMDYHENIIEASAANVFCRYQDHWLTPSVSQCGVAGVMRSFILEHCPKAVVVEHLSQSQLAESDAVFVCNALMTLVPVSQIHLANGQRTLSVEPVIDLAQTMADLMEAEYASV
jgi:4-amino-4-deoxychorismate lyase